MATVGTEWNPAAGGDDGYLLLEVPGVNFITRESFLFFGRIVIESSAPQWRNVPDVADNWAEEPVPPPDWQPV